MCKKTFIINLANLSHSFHGKFFVQVEIVFFRSKIGKFLTKMKTPVNVEKVIFSLFFSFPFLSFLTYLLALKPFVCLGFFSTHGSGSPQLNSSSPFRLLSTHKSGSPNLIFNPLPSPLCAQFEFPPT